MDSDAVLLQLRLKDARKAAVGRGAGAEEDRCRLCGRRLQLCPHCGGADPYTRGLYCPRCECCCGCAAEPHPKTVGPYAL